MLVSCILCVYGDIAPMLCNVTVHLTEELTAMSYR